MTTTNRCSHHHRQHFRNVSAVQDESFLVVRVRVYVLRRWAPILAPMAPRPRMEDSLSRGSVPQTSTNSGLAKSSDQAAHDPACNTLQTKTDHVLAPVHHTHTATLHSPRTYTTRRVSMVVVVQPVKAEVGLDPMFHSDSNYVDVDAARKMMKAYRNIRHSHPFRVRWGWGWDSHWGSCLHRYHIVRTIRSTPIQGIENGWERGIVLAVDDGMSTDEGEGVRVSKTHAHSSLGPAVDGHIRHDDGVVVVVVAVHLGTLVHPRTAH